jgi:hypothetical protein
MKTIFTNRKFQAKIKSAIKDKMQKNIPLKDNKPPTGVI